MALSRSGRLSVICVTPSPISSTNTASFTPSSSRSPASRPVAASLGDPNRAHHVGEAPRSARSTPSRRRVPTSASVRSVASTLKSAATSRAADKRGREPVDAPQAGHVPPASVVGDRSRCARSARSTAAADLAPKPGSPGKPSALSPTSASQSGIDSGGTPNLSLHAVGVEQDLAAAVELHDLAADALAEVLVGRADDHLLDPTVRRRRPWPRSPSASSASSSTIAHTATPSASSASSSSWELAEQLGIESLAGLVRRPRGRCGTTRSRGRRPRRGASRPTRACRAPIRPPPGVAPTSTPSSSRWPGRGARYWRNSSYVPSTRCTSHGPSLAHGRRATRSPAARPCVRCRRGGARRVGRRPFVRR